MARFDTVLSFSRDDDPEAAHQPTNDKQADAAADCDGSDDDDDDLDAGFEFAFAPPLTAAGRDAEDMIAPADDLFAHGRILPAYPVFDRRRSLRQEDDQAAAAAAAAPPDSYCAWAPRSAPGSPAREFPKSASTGEARRFWRLRDLVGGRSHSDGKEKFLFLQPAASPAAAPSKMAKTEGNKQANKPSAPLQKQKQKQGKKKGAVTEMDMATAHKLFYGKQQHGGGSTLPGDRRQQHSYLPYRTGIVGFFASAHALGRSHHPY